MTLVALHICDDTGSTYFSSMHSTPYWVFAHHIYKKVVEMLSFGLRIHITSHTLLIATGVCMLTKLTMSSDG